MSSLNDSFLLAFSVPLWGALPLLIYVERAVYMTSPSPTRTPHVTRPSNLYKEGQGSPKRDKKQEAISRARHKGEPAYGDSSHENNET